MKEVIPEITQETIQKEEINMKKYITLIYSLVLTLCLSGCTEERWLENGENTGQDNGMPIEFVMNINPIQALTRADENNIVVINEKTEFSEGDIIQIVANFYSTEENTDGTTDGTTEKFYSSACCILTYDENGNWVNKSEINLSWPWEELVTGKFQAFYYHGFDGLIKLNGKTEEYTPKALLDFDDLGNLPAPLMTKEVTVEYGNAVKLTFKHQCARLVLTDYESVIGNSYDRLWLEDKKNNSEGKNAFKLGLKKNTENKKLSFSLEFTSVKDENRALIGGKKTEFTESESESEDKKNAIVFYLPPGDYSKVSLVRRFGYPLLSWDVPASTTTDGNNSSLNILEAGKSYTVSLEELQGNITIDDDDDWWKDDEFVPSGDGFSLEKFLESIGSGSSYSYTNNAGKEVSVLEATKETVNGVSITYLKLKTGVDFNNYDGKIEVGLGNGVVFDGGRYSFKNIAQPVFSKVEGAIQNLGINTINTTQIKLNSEKHNFGILARENHGTIDNIRLNNININVIELYNGDGIVNMVGTMVGHNLGKISNIELNNIKITVSDTEVQSGTSLILGGLIGQGGAGSSLEGVGMFDDDNIEVTNNTAMTVGSVYTGGLVGLSSGNIQNCAVRANVDASQATGTWVYTGGIAGAMRNTIDNVTPASTTDESGESDEESLKISFINSNNEGDVTGGVCIYNNQGGSTSSQGHSSTGGLIGYSLNTDIDNCTVKGEISSIIRHENVETYYEFYTIGGLVGAVRAAKSEQTELYPAITDNSVYSTFNTELDNHKPPTDAADTYVHYCYIGWLAGIAPENVKNNTTNKKLVANNYDKVGYLSNKSPSGN